MISAPAGGRCTVFGTSAVLIVSRVTALPPARALIDRELAAVDIACSRYRPASQLSELNGLRGAEMQVTELLAGAIGEAPRAAGLTATVPGSTVSSAIVPGSIVPDSTVPGAIVPGCTVPRVRVPGSTVPNSSLPSEAA
jgi:hypothetical protein